MSRGVVVGCDKNQEWMLKWWWSHYQRHNDYRVAFIDFGMSHDARNWCRQHGQSIELKAPHHFVYPKALITPSLVEEWELVYGKELWHGRERWFYKPFALQQTPFAETIWVDLDCQINGTLAPLFDKVHHHSKMALVKEQAQEDVYNSGVIVYHADSPLLAQWSELCLYQNDQFLGDQDVLSYLIEKNGIEITELPSHYNWVVRSGVHPQPVILHWAGLWGKQVIRQGTT